jgi:hypothetical protein
MDKAVVVAAGAAITAKEMDFPCVTKFYQIDYD